MSKLYKAAKRIVPVFLAIVLSAILSSCDMHDDVKPRNQDDTRWITADQNIFFSVMYDGNYNICLGALKTTETVYHISLEFDYGSGLIISDYDGSLRNVGVVKSICKQVQTAAYQCSNHGISATGGFISHGYSFFRNRVSFVN